MRLRNILPLHVMWQAGIKDEELAGVFSGIINILWWANVSWEFDIERLGQRRDPNWLNRNRNKFRKYKSLDWHIWWARKNSRVAGHLNSTVLLDSLRENPTFKKHPRYELVVVREPLHWKDDNVGTVSGVARPGTGAVITLHHHLPQPGDSDADRKNKEENIFLSAQMLTMHELGHIFGLCPEAGEADAQQKETHCLNDCVMTWQENSVLERKIEKRPFCDKCLANLIQNFVVR